MTMDLPTALAVIYYIENRDARCGVHIHMTPQAERLYVKAQNAVNNAGAMALAMSCAGRIKVDLPADRTTLSPTAAAAYHDDIDGDSE